MISRSSDDGSALSVRKAVNATTHSLAEPAWMRAPMSDEVIESDFSQSPESISIKVLMWVPIRTETPKGGNMDSTVLFGLNDAGRPNIPSELLEPNMIDVFTSFIEAMRCESELPDEMFFRDWGLRFEGISMLVSAAGSTHASLSMGPLFHDVSVAGGLCDWISGCAEEKPARAQKLWDAAQGLNE